MVGVAVFFLRSVLHQAKVVLNVVFFYLKNARFEKHENCYI